MVINLRSSKKLSEDELDDSYPGTQFCDALNCKQEIFSSCHICAKLLCFQHFTEDDYSKHACNPKISSKKKFISNSQQKKSACDICGNLFTSVKIHKTKFHKDKVSQPEKGSDPTSDNNQADLHTRLASLKKSIRVIKRLPKATRIVAASRLSKLINNCVDLNTLDSWENLLTFTYTYLHYNFDQPRKQSITATILRHFKDCSTPSIDTSGSLKRNPKKGSNINSIIGKVSDGDLSGAIRLLSSEEPVAKFSNQSMALLQEKHPCGSNEDLSNLAPTITPLSVSKHDVLMAVKSFNPGSAGGLDSLRPSHIQDMLSHSAGNAGDLLLSSITSLCNLMLSGKVNQEVTPVLYGASLCALSKKDGGIRPIAVGNFFRRLVAKLCCFHLKDKLGVFFRPFQYGFGTRGGCEAVVHAAREYTFFNNEATDEVFLKLDFKNAFNSISRKVMLTEAAKISPDIYSFVFQCYSINSFLIFGPGVILSQTGVQQGDPLGPMLFCLTINNLIKSLQSNFNCWYLDDGSLGGKPAIVLKDLKLIVEQSKSLGLELNFEKCELFFVKEVFSSVVSKFKSICPGIKILDHSNLYLLGSPLTDGAMSFCLKNKMQSFEKMLSKLECLPKHMSYILLKHCLAFPKFIYFLRCYPAWRLTNILYEIDNLFRSSLEKICNTVIDEFSWKQASLPVDIGGLGIRSIHSLALPCFLSSYCFSQDLIKIILPSSFSTLSDTNFSEGSTIWHRKTGLFLSETQQKIQKNWDRPLLDLVARDLLESASTTEIKARLMAVSSPESGAWLNALPVSSLGTLLDDESFRIAVGLRLGSPICAKHFCKCKNLVSEYGLHGLSCRFSFGRFSRHHEVNDLIKKALISAEIPAILEPVGTSRDDGKRPDGMSLIPWCSGRPVVWDFTCVDTLAPSHVLLCSKKAGSAACFGETNKMKKYLKLQSNYIFYPVGIETFGVWGQNALKFIKDIGKRISAVNKDNRSTSFLIQRISIAVQRGNAASVLGSIRSNVDAGDY